MNAQLDLCEDPDLNVRIAAIKGLQKICEGSPNHIPKVCDVLGQLLLTDEPSEIRTVKTVYTTLFNLDFEGKAVYQTFQNCFYNQGRLSFSCNFGFVSPNFTGRRRSSSRSCSGFL